MRRSSGAILRERRPATIIRSDWRGLPRNTSAPKRAMSYREQLIDIISMAQQASPKVTGQMDERRAHWTIFSTVVVRTGISDSRPIRIKPSALLFSPVEHALAPDIDVPGEQQSEEEHNLNEARPSELAQRHRPRIEERDLDVEEQENHRDQVELHRLALARVADRRHAALVGRGLFGSGLSRTEEPRQDDRDQ